MYKKGQTSVELLMILAISMVVILAIFAFSTDRIGTFDSMMRIETGNKMLDDIHSSAKDVYRQGSGARDTIYVSMPEALENVTIDQIENTHRIKLDYITGDTQYKNFDFGIGGKIPASQGRQKLELEAIPGAVLIGEEIEQIKEDHMPECGDGEIGLGQECDGQNLAGKTCADFGFVGGELDCTNCRFDTSGCVDFLHYECDQRDNCELCVMDGECMWCEGEKGGHERGCKELDGDCHHNDEYYEGDNCPVSFFDVEIMDTNSPVAEGQDLEIEVIVENTGYMEDTQNIDLYDFDNSPVDTEPIGLGTNEEEEITLSWGTDVGDEGTGEIIVASEDDHASETIEIEELPEDCNDRDEEICELDGECEWVTGAWGGGECREA